MISISSSQSARGLRKETPGLYRNGGENMSEITLTNNERLEEVGRILAIGALRLLSKKRNMHQKTDLLPGQKKGSL